MTRAARAPPGMRRPQDTHTHFQERDAASAGRRAIAFEGMPERIAERFGLAQEATVNALEIVRRKEDRHD